MDTSSHVTGTALGALFMYIACTTSFVSHDSKPIFVRICCYSHHIFEVGCTGTRPILFFLFRLFISGGGGNGGTGGFFGRLRHHGQYSSCRRANACKTLALYGIKIAKITGCKYRRWMGEHLENTRFATSFRASCAP